MGTIGIAIFFIILGIVVKYGKMFSLIAGYNTLPEKEKAKYDIEELLVYSEMKCLVWPLF